MSSITAVVITRNEEEVIEDCLRSLDFVDEIIVIDSNSTDKTAEIARKLNSKVISHPFVNFSETRNFALKHVNTDWILYIDADERVTTELKRGILKAITTDHFQAYSLKRKNFYLGKEWPYRENLTRLFMKDKLKGWKGILHESPDVDGTIRLLEGELLHNAHRNIEQMLNKTNTWSNIEARLRFDNNHLPVKWWRLIRVFITGFFNSYINQKGFLAGNIGFIESYYQGFSLFVTYVKLWELQKSQKLRS